MITLLLSGCFMAPGSNIDSSAIRDRSWFQEGDGVWFPGLLDGGEEEQPPIGELVEILPITPELLSNQQAVQPAAAENATPASPELLQAIEDYDYEIGPGDILQVVVYDHPELTNPAGSQRTTEQAGNTVRNDGTIFYPYIGEVQASGLTVEQVRQDITEQLTEYINAPQVDVKVLGFLSKRAYVTGQVEEPGPIPITNVPLTVLDAISQAGGLAESANWHEVILARESGEEIRLSVHDMLNNGQLSQNTLLRHGDTLHVPDIGQQKVFVMGELGSVNSIGMGNLRMSLTEAIAQSGGINQMASNASGIFVIRGTPPGSEQLATVYQLDARNAISFALGSRFMLQPTDIVYVTTAPVTRWNRVLDQILPSLTTILRLDNLGETLGD